MYKDYHLKFAWRPQTRRTESETTNSSEYLLQYTDETKHGKEAADYSNRRSSSQTPLQTTDISATRQAYACQRLIAHVGSETGGRARVHIVEV